VLASVVISPSASGDTLLELLFPVAQLCSLAYMEFRRTEICVPRPLCPLVRLGRAGPFARCTTTSFSDDRSRGAGAEWAANQVQVLAEGLMHEVGVHPRDYEPHAAFPPEDGLLG
jgi:hypothetical protein